MKTGILLLTMAMLSFQLKAEVTSGTIDVVSAYVDDVDVSGRKIMMNGKTYRVALDKKSSILIGMEKSLESLSLRDIKPGQTYQFEIKSKKSRGRMVDSGSIITIVPADTRLPWENSSKQVNRTQDR